MRIKSVCPIKYKLKFIFIKEANIVNHMIWNLKYNRENKDVYF